MKIVHVIPIARGITTDQLSYFTSTDAEEGSIISVPLRSRTVPALVVHTEEVSDVKTRLKNASYSIRKTNARSAKQIFLPAFIRAAHRLSDYYASTKGAVLFSILPTTIINEIVKLDIQKPTEKETTIAIEKLVLQAERTDRIEHYKNIAREGFARKQSLLVVAPAMQEAERLYTALSKGVEKYTFLFHSGMTKPALREAWEKALKEKHPIIIVMTGGFLSLPRTDIHTIVVERENSPFYKAQSRPFVDTRLVAEFLAEEIGARFIVADFPLSITAVSKYFAREYDEFAPFKVRAVGGVTTTILDMRDKEKKFALFHKNVKQALVKNHDAGEHTFLFTSRRGLSPITVCQDCGNPVVCEVTGAPVVLHKSAKGNVFVCHASGTVRSAQEKCKFCGSWKLQSLGIGIDLVADELEKEFPTIPVFVVDKEKAKTHKEVKRLLKEFYATKGAVLVGTELVLPYLDAPVATSAVISIDSLLSLPEWNVYERVFSILIRIREATTNDLFIQTRKTEQAILSFAANGNTNDFYRQEMAERKQFGYPPFATFIRITLEGTESALEKQTEELERLLAPFECSGYSHNIHTGNNRYKLHSFLRIEKEVWPDTNLVERLRLLPPSIIVTVDPQSIL